MSLRCSSRPMTRPCLPPPPCPPSASTPPPWSSSLTTGTLWRSVPLAPPLHFSLLQQLMFYVPMTFASSTANDTDEFQFSAKEQATIIFFKRLKNILEYMNNLWRKQHCHCRVQAVLHVANKKGGGIDLSSLPCGRQSNLTWLLLDE